MEIQLQSVEPGLIYLRCRGILGQALTGDSNDPLLTLLSTQSWQGNVLLDLRDVDSIGTESIGWLVHWHRWVTRAGGVLGLCSLPPQLRDVFRLCHLQQFLPIWENEVVAREALAARKAAPTVAPPLRPGPAPEVETEAELEHEEKVIPMPLPPPAMNPFTGVPEEGGRSAGKVLEILVVDDSSVERRRAGSALEKRSDGLAGDGGLHVLYANNGREALTLMQTTRPNLVVTDLVMPELDGLGLVKEIRLAYPSIPVVLMTAHGSEEIAAAALRAGAASYVPKKYLARDLRETVETILRLAEADREQLIFPHLTVSEYRFLLPCNLSLISPLVDFLQGHLERVGVCQDGVEELRVALAVREALVNAFTHGTLEAPGELRETNYQAYLRSLTERQNQAPYKDRRVHVTAREAPREVVYTIRDEGPGFDPSALPDPTSSENFKKASGRGLYLIRTFMTEVGFNDTGNEITLIKRKSE